MIVSAQHSTDAAENIAQAAALLKAGALVGFPTETVYGLGADAGNDAAVAQVYAAKGRPSDHPLIVHVLGRDQAGLFAAQVPVFAERLMQAFWPGPVSLILPRRAGVATAAAGGQGSVGLRCPSHPVARALLSAALDAGVVGVAAPSANRFGRISPTTASHVETELGSELLILDGGACAVGIESTIIDCTRAAPVLLRPGVLEHTLIEQACGVPLLAVHAMEGVTPKASGTLESHYAPRATLRLMDARSLQVALDLLGTDVPTSTPSIAVYARTPLRVRSAAILSRRMPDDAAAAAQQLFAALRALDDQGVRLIWVETPPPFAAWDGVRDRLQRAAAEVLQAPR